MNKKIILLPVIQIICAVCWWALWLSAIVFQVSVPSLTNQALTWNQATTECAGQWPEAPIWKDPALEGSSCTCAGKTNCIPSELACYRCGPMPFDLGWKFWTMVLELFWMNGLLVAIGQCTIAGAVGVWYFNQDNLSSVKPVTTGLYNSFRYHLGSLAFGSFILAVVKTVKWWLRYMKKQFAASGNAVMAKIAACLAYCVKCFERCIEFLNKNAYIRIALVGDNFCKAAWKAFSLIVRNAARYAVVGGLGVLISIIGIMFICAASSVTGYYILLAAFPNLANPWFCVAIYAIMGYLAGKLVMNVFSLAVDSCLVCFITDEELNGSAKHAPKELKAFYKEQKDNKKETE